MNPPQSNARHSPCASIGQLGEYGVRQRVVGGFASFCPIVCLAAWPLLAQSSIAVLRAHRRSSGVECA